MSAHETPPPSRRRVQVQVGGELYEGMYRADSGVLTVWYGSSATSVRLQKGPAQLQAEMLLVDMLTSGSHRDD